MTVDNQVITLVERFLRPLTLTSTPDSSPFGWTLKDNSSAGTPTWTTLSGGGLKLLLAATSEEEVATLYQNDILPFYLSQLQRVWFIASVGGIDAVTTLTLGVASAQSDTEDSITTNAWARMQGSASTSALVVETDDNTLNLDDKATGKTLAGVDKEIAIDFTYGLGNVKFFIDGDRVADSTTFDMSLAGATDKVQLFAQIHKASGTGVPYVTIKEVGVQYRVRRGA